MPPCCACAANGCYQWSWNEKSSSHHCFLSSSKTWKGKKNKHVVSGCVAGKVTGCPKPSPPLPPPPPSPLPPAGHTPFWTAPRPNDKLPLSGYDESTTARQHDITTARQHDRTIVPEWLVSIDTIIDFVPLCSHTCRYQKIPNLVDVPIYQPHGLSDGWYRICFYLSHR